MNVYSYLEIASDIFQYEGEYLDTSGDPKVISEMKKFSFYKKYSSYCEQRGNLNEDFKLLDFKDKLVEFFNDCAIPEMNELPNKDKDYTVYVKTGDTYVKVMEYSSGELSPEEVFKKFEAATEGFNSILVYDETIGLMAPMTRKYDNITK